MKQFVRYVKNGLIQIGDIVGRIMTIIILYVVYITIIALMWCIAKIFRKQFIDTRFDPTIASYWIPIDPKFNVHTLEKWKLPFNML